MYQGPSLDVSSVPELLDSAFHILRGQLLAADLKHKVCRR